MIIALADIKSSKNQLVFVGGSAFFMRNEIYLNKKLFISTSKYNPNKLPRIDIHKGLNRCIHVITPLGAANLLFRVYPESRRMISGKIVDMKNNPIPYASGVIYNENNNYYTFEANAVGEFEKIILNFLKSYTYHLYLLLVIFK